MTARELLAATATALVLTGYAAAQEEAPRPVRHDVPQASEREFLVLRHQSLVEGSHERFYELSRAGVWPLYEEIGARIVGQWRVLEPDRGGDSYDEGYRLARYRSYEHWRATRRPEELAGNGGDLAAARAALAARRRLLRGSDGAVYLEGEMAPGGPYYWPALPEAWIESDEPAPAEGALPRRHGAALEGDEIVTLRRFEIRKGSFEEFYRLSRDGVWPYFEKMGARVIGQWKRVYPAANDPGGPADTADAPVESHDHDEVFMMVRYASRRHWEATRPDVMAKLGGDGPDYAACVAALAARRELTRATSVEILQGHLYESPPLYLPALDESFVPSP